MLRMMLTAVTNNDNDKGGEEGERGWRKKEGSKGYKKEETGGEGG